MGQRSGRLDPCVVKVMASAHQFRIVKKHQDAKEGEIIVLCVRVLSGSLG